MSKSKDEQQRYTAVFIKASKKMQEMIMVFDFAMSLLQQEANNMFWLRGDPDSDFQAPTMVFDNNVNGTNKHFSGYKLPVFLVKEKTNL